MIKANELRPGNLIDYCDPITNEIKTVVIDALKKSIGSFQIKHDSYIELWLPLLNCEGIPLTPEWLDRCGFEDNSNNNEDGDEIDWMEHPNIKDITYRNGILARDLGNRKMPHIQFLHQLQNLYFALIGEELTIKLTE